MITRIVKMTFRNDATDAFQKIFHENKSMIGSFPGCTSLKLMRQSDRPEVFFTISTWESEQALNNYRSSDLFSNTWVRTKVLFADKPEAWTLLSSEIGDGRRE